MFAPVDRESIFIPTVALQWDDWTDQEKVFLALMAYIHNTELREDLYTEYNMYTKDLSVLLHTQVISSASGYLDNIRRMYRVGIVDEYNVYIKPHDDMFDEKLRNRHTLVSDNISIIKTVIEDRQALRTYAYLAGRIAGSKDLITDYCYREVESERCHPRVKYAFRNSYND
jgi:hypothetical protein